MIDLDKSKNILIATQLHLVMLVAGVMCYLPVYSQSKNQPASDKLTNFLVTHSTEKVYLHFKQAFTYKVA